MAASNLHKWATLPDPSPAELARAAEGDAQAFTLIVERYQGMVYSVAFNVLGNHTDAEDAAQEAFLRCYRKLPQFRRILAAAAVYTERPARGAAHHDDALSRQASRADLATLRPRARRAL